MASQGEEHCPEPELRRSMRDRRPPVRFGNPLVQDSSSRSERRHRTKIASDEHIRQRFDACIDKIERNGGKARQLMAKSGSADILLECSDRITEAWEQLNGTASHETEEEINPEDLAKVDNMLDRVEAKVEAYKDDIRQHLHERETDANTQRRLDEPDATFRTPTAASTPRRPGTAQSEATGLVDHRLQAPTSYAPIRAHADAAEDGRPGGDQLRDADVGDFSDPDDAEYSSTLGDPMVFNNALVNALEKLALRAEIPATAPIVFDGNAANYMAFTKDFDERIGNRNLSEAAKMAHLLQSTSGKAREAVESLHGQDNGYTLAKKALSERFGQPYQILDACHRRLTRWKQHDNKDPEKFVKFADQLWADYKMFRSQDLLKEVDHQSHLKLIFDRLPPKSQGRWVEKANELEDKGDRPSYKTMVEFVKTQARKSSHPVYRITQIPPSGNTAPSQPILGTRSRQFDIGDTPGRNYNERRPTTLVAAGEPPQYSPVSWGPPSDFPQHTAALTPRPPGQPWRQPGPEARTWNSPDQFTCQFCNRGHHILLCPLFALKPAQVRREFVERTRLCYKCLGEHFARNCRSRTTCSVRGCGKGHHRLLHLEDRRAPPQNSSFGNAEDQPRRLERQNEQQESSPSPELSATLNSLGVNTHVFLRVVPVRISVKDKTLTTYALLDTGSTCSMMSRTLADEFGIKGEPHQINLSTVIEQQQVSMEFVDVTVGPAAGTEPIIQIRDTHIVPQLAIDSKFKQDQVDVSVWEHLKPIPLPQQSVDVDKVTVLLGEDLPRAHIVLDAVYGEDLDNQPYAIKTPFGWCLAGPTSKREKRDTHRTAHYVEQSTLAIDEENTINAIRDLENAVSRMWNEERHGFSSETQAMSVDDKRALQVLDAQVKLCPDGHYSAPLLWKNPSIELPNNFSVAKACLDQLARKFGVRPEYKEMYVNTVQGYIDKGYARKLTDDQVRGSGCRVWYLPHHGVENPHKPGKVRVVFNAASRFRGISLNDNLLSGPDINNNMVGTLLRFRRGPVAISADVTEMFHQVWVHDEDRDSLRFLWWPQGDSDKTPSVFRMERHIFGAADSPCVCVYALQRAARDNREAFSPEAIDAVLRSMYVDDLLRATPSVDHAIHLAKEVRELLGRGGFNLTKFVSTSPRVTAALPDECVQPGCDEVSFGDMPTQRALGVKWEVPSDTLGVKVDLLNRPLTRRGCLSFICSITDPFGLAAPTSMIGKRIVQEACRRQLEWDTPLPEDLAVAWEKWKTSLSSLGDLRIHRCFRGFENSHQIMHAELHNFCDASEEGYGVVSYLRVELRDSTVHCSFILSKSRTPPLRFLSIPRLELQATVVAARVANFLREQLEIAREDIIIWTDSVIALQYIRNHTKRLKTYAANRVQEIRDIIDPAQVRHCPTRQNVADIASRGLLGNKLVKDKNWLEGPEFLRQPKETWPADPTQPEIPSDDAEIKTKERTLLAADPTPTPSDKLIFHYSSWHRLLYAVSFFHKLVHYRKAKTNSQDVSTRLTHVTAQNLHTAELSVVRYVQKLEFPDVIEGLSRGQDVRKTSFLLKLCPVLVDGVLRVGGRLAEAPLSFTQRHPVILPKRHHVSTLVIRHVHASLAHAGPLHTLAALRSKYWVIGARSTIKASVKNCFVCRRLHSRLMTQIMAELPKERITPFQPPFSITGCDVLGPLTIKRGRRPIKIYVVLFTCFSVRAIHLELLQALTTESFLMALFRFAARRGPVRQIWCDNGTNFVGGARELRESTSLALKEVNTALSKKGIEWHFQTPGSPHMNGVWERLVKSVKTAMRATFGNAMVSEEVFHTTVVQIESILNSRPITPATDDITDLDALTPNHFLLGKTAPCDDHYEQFSNCYRRQWQYSQFLLTQHWNRWIREYLPTLQLRSKWRQRQRDVRVGDLVLVSEQNVKRSCWPLARVTDVEKGRDGMVRVVTVKTSQGTYKRAIHKLCLLEGAPEPVVSATRRSARIAAGGV